MFQSAHFNHAAEKSAATDDTAVLLVNLGTPAAPTAAAVRPYLRQFLSDPRVVELPRWLWWLVLRCVILPLRGARSARAYAKVWNKQGSPLLYLSQQLAVAVQRQLHNDAPPGEVSDEVHHNPRIVLAMTYGEPSIASVLQQLQQGGVRKLLVLPLYPQYSATTTASVFDAVSNELQTMRWIPELRFINHYFHYEEWQQAVADRIVAFREASPQATPDSGEHQPLLLFSFHGIPQRYFRQGDPYYCQCHASARLIAARLGLADDQWQVSFQSRLGREPWLQPYTDQTLEALASQGVRHVQVVCPGFAVDCLETLEEIAIENRQLFEQAGGQRLDYIPALNDSESHARALATIVHSHSHGWPDWQTADTQGRAKRASQRAALDGYSLPTTSDKEQ